jgi:aminoglycoside 6'-N-acetyltransferase I
MKTREARLSDLPRLAAMRAALWPDDTADGHAKELTEILEGRWSGVYPMVIFVAEVDGQAIGFADVTLRSYADGCDPAQPVGYLEGWFVEEAHRRRGAGAALVRAAEEWSRAQGCTEMASDTWIDNEGSHRAHAALGFEVVDRVVTFRKALLFLLLFLNVATGFSPSRGNWTAEANPKMVPHYRPTNLYPAPCTVAISDASPSFCRNAAMRTSTVRVSGGSS